MDIQGKRDFQETQTGKRKYVQLDLNGRQPFGQHGFARAGEDHPQVMAAEARLTGML